MDDAEAGKMAKSSSSSVETACSGDSMARSTATLEAAERLEVVEWTEGAERLRKAGEEVVEMLGAGKEGMKPKAAIAVAVDAFEAAGVQAKKKKGSS